MFSSILNSVTAFLQSHITSNWFLPFINILMAITGVYIIVWMIYKSFGIMQGRDSAQDLMLGISKFVVLFCILFMTSLIPTIGGYLTGFASSMQIAKPLDSAGNAIKKSISEIQTTWKGFDVDFDELRKLPPDELDKVLRARAEEKYKEELEKFDKAARAADAALDACEKRDNYSDNSLVVGTLKDVWQFCFSTGINCSIPAKSAADAWADKGKFQQDRDKFINDNIASLKEKGEFTKPPSYSLGGAAVNAGKTIVNGAVNGLAGIDNLTRQIEYMAKAIVASILLAVGISLFFPLAMKIIQMAIQFVISLFALAAAVPLAAISLLYGKYFKNIYDKWFGMSIHSIISIPILIMVLIASFESVSGFVSGAVKFIAGVPEVDLGKLIYYGATGGKAQSFDNLDTRVASLIAIFLGIKIIMIILENVTKFLDELLGGSFSSGAGQTAAGMADKAGAMVAGATVGAAGKTALGTANLGMKGMGKGIAKGADKALGLEEKRMQKDAERAYKQKLYTKEHAKEWQEKYGG